jgi:hypothetical protein
MFREPGPQRSFPTAAVVVAAIVVVVVIAVLVVMGRRHAPVAASNSPQPAAAYATNLALTNLQMSESESLSGGKSTYLDGHIANHGPATVTGITVQVVFPNDTGQPPQMQTVPLNLVRTRTPYVDTEPVSAAPLGPGGEADFRLIFEDVSDTWNQQTPTVRVTGVETR